MKNNSKVIILNKNSIQSNYLSLTCTEERHFLKCNISESTLLTNSKGEITPLEFIIKPTVNELGQVSLKKGIQAIN